MNPYTVAFIFARGGSRGVPRKNIRMLAGKPLIAYAIEAGLSCEHVDKVVVSTDDEEIAAVAREFGAEIPFLRPAELARDDSPEWLAWQHAVRVLNQASERKIEIFVSIPPTSPLRSIQDINRCIEKLQQTDADLVLMVKPAARSPYFNMVVLDKDDNAELVIKPQEAIHRRQDAPRVFDITTVAYAAKPEYILGASHIFEGRVRGIVVPAERAIDIDNEFDFRLAALLLEHADRTLDEETGSVY